MFSEKRPNLDQSRDSRVVTVAVPGLHVEICGGESAARAGGLHGHDLGGLGALRVEVTFTGYLALGGGDYAPKVGVRRGEASGLIGQLCGTSDVRGLERVISVVVDSGLAEYRWSVCS